MVMLLVLGLMKATAFLFIISSFEIITCGITIQIMNMDLVCPAAFGTMFSAPSSK